MELTGNQILFRPFPAAELNEFGLYIPETARKTYNKGVIAKTGNGDKIQLGKKTLQKVGYELSYEIVDEGHEYNKAKSINQDRKRMWWMPRQ